MIPSLDSSLKVKWTSVNIFNYMEATTLYKFKIHSRLYNSVNCNKTFPTV